MNSPSVELASDLPRMELVEAAQENSEAGFRAPMRLLDRRLQSLDLNEMSLPSLVEQKDPHAPSDLAQLIQVVVMGASLVALFIAA